MLPQARALMYPRNRSESVGCPNDSKAICKERASELHSIFSWFAYAQRIFRITQVLRIRNVFAMTNGIIACLPSNFLAQSANRIEYANAGN